MVVARDTGDVLLYEPLNDPERKHAVEMMRPAVLRKIYGIDLRVEVDDHRIGICFV